MRPFAMVAGVALATLVLFTAAAEGAPGRIVFEGGQAIWSVNPDGSGLRRLAAGHAADPVVSPDGTQVLFWRPGGRSGRPYLWVVASEGGPARILSRVAAYPTARWSPDGATIAFESWTNRASYLADVASGQTRRLAACHIRFAWSPDGTQLAYGRGDGNRAHDQRSRDNGVGCLGLSWSPDGTKLAFVGDARHVFVMNADGSGEPRLGADVSAPTTPVWSPLGSEIAFTSSFAGTDAASIWFTPMAPGS